MRITLRWSAMAPEFSDRVNVNEPLAHALLPLSGRVGS